MFQFHESIFSENHKSYYNETDLKALDECRTIVPNGRLLKAKDYDSKGYEPVLAPEDMCSIDTRKPTHTKQQRLHTFQCSTILMCGNHTPTKNDFNKFNNYTLFIVMVCQGNICFLTKK